VGLALVVCTVLAGGAWGLRSWLRGPFENVAVWYTLGMVLLYAGVCVILYRCLGGMHRWLKAPIDTLQREVAVEIAWDVARRKMMR
jgi:hypothetical protein